MGVWGMGGVKSRTPGDGQLRSNQLCDFSVAQQIHLWVMSYSYCGNQQFPFQEGHKGFVEIALHHTYGRRHGLEHKQPSPTHAHTHATEL